MRAVTSDGIVISDFQKVQNAAKNIRNALNLDIRGDINATEVPNLLKQMRNYHWTGRVYDNKGNVSPEFKIPLTRFINWVCHAGLGDLGVSGIVLKDGLLWLRPIMAHARCGTANDRTEIQNIIKKIRR
jgi:hypothetical protein